MWGGVGLLEREFWVLGGGFGRVGGGGVTECYLDE